MRKCPECGRTGHEVEKITVANHVKETCWPLGDREFFICETPGCEVIYFSSDLSRIFRRSDVKTRVTFKEKDPPRPLCYCKQVTEEDVLRAIESGASTLEDVKRMTGIGGGGYCKITNPGGRCCSRNYKPFIEEALKRAGKA